MRRLAALCAAVIATNVAAPIASAQVFEVIHPDVVEGGFELEILTGVALGGVEDGEERSAHEFAISYSPFDFWKTTFAVEIAKPQNESAEVEAFEWGNVLLLPIGDGHGAEHSHEHEEFFALEAVGLFVGLEVPNAGGIGSGAIEVGPIAEIALGPVDTVTNFVFEIPFEDEEGTGIAYAMQAKYPVFDPFAVGFEAFGSVENAFEGDSEDEHFIGPAFFSEFDIGRGRVLEPRLAILFGLTEDAPDAVASFNVELKF